MNKTECQRRNIRVPPFSPKLGDMVLDPRASPKPTIKSNCGKAMKPTICASHLRTLNTQAPCGSPDDIYQLSPWRAPGAAPVIDSCGTAGGRLAGMGEEPGCLPGMDSGRCRGATQAIFSNSSLAKENERGSRLPPMPPQASWKAGAAVEVGWSLKYQHGGGYIYRLAPADAPLTESTFDRMPLEFVGPSFLRWDGDPRTQLAFNATRVSVGTRPAGSTWQKNPPGVRASLRADKSALVHGESAQSGDSGRVAYPRGLEAGTLRAGLEVGRRGDDAGLAVVLGCNDRVTAARWSAVMGDDVV